MELRQLLNQNRYKAEEVKTTEWQELGKELTEKFGTNCYWVPWKFPIWMIRDKMKTAGDNGFGYFIGALRNEMKNTSESAP